MQLVNSESRYGWLAIIGHWLTTLLVIGLFLLGIWMVELDYYSQWYKVAPDIHRSLGIILFGLVSIRLCVKAASPSPLPAATLQPWERWLARAMHGCLYILLCCTMIAGYLISTADGRPIDVFGLIQVPAIFTSLDRQEDIAGALHYYLAVALVVLAGLHALAALKHHFINKDDTLIRMLGRTSVPEKNK